MRHTLSSTTSLIGGSPSGFCMQTGLNWKPNRKALLYGRFPLGSARSGQPRERVNIVAHILQGRQSTDAENVQFYLSLISLQKNLSYPTSYCDPKYFQSLTTWWSIFTTSKQTICSGHSVCLCLANKIMKVADS